MSVRKKENRCLIPGDCKHYSADGSCSYRGYCDYKKRKLLPEKKKINWQAGRTIRRNSLEEDIGFNSALDLCTPILAAKNTEIASLQKENEELRNVAKSASAISEKQMYEIEELKSILQRQEKVDIDKIADACMYNFPKSFTDIQIKAFQKGVDNVWSAVKKAIA